MEGIISPILLSLKVATISTIITLILGVALSYVVVRYKSPLNDVFEAILILPMVLPPSVTGYILLILFGKRGFIGIFLQEHFGFSVIFTWIACCIASVVVSIPLMYQSCKSAFISVDEVYLNSARTLGASELKVFFKVLIPLSIPGILSGVVLAFARALGEFGATLMIAGNIPNKTQTIPTAIYYAIDSKNSYVANTLTTVVIVFSFIVIFSLNRWLKKQRIK